MSWLRTIVRAVALRALGWADGCTYTREVHRPRAIGFTA